MSGFLAASLERLELCWPELLARGFLVAGYGFSVFLAAAWWLGWLTDLSGHDWGLKAFAAMGSLAGFMLAGLAILHNLKAKAESDEVAAAQSGRVVPMIAVIRCQAWNNLVRAITASMWAWMLAGGAGLVCFFIPWRGVELPFLVLTGLALGYGLHALMWLTVAARWLRNDLS